MHSSMKMFPSGKQLLLAVLVLLAIGGVIGAAVVFAIMAL
jgi:hypothetical protein